MIDLPFKVALWAIAHPRWAIAWLLAATLVAAPGLMRLDLRTDGHALVPPEDPVVVFDAEVREHFQVRDPIVVFLETRHAEGIYNLATLRRVGQLTDALRRIEGIEPERLMSLATEHRNRVYPGTLNFRPFLDPLPETPRLMDQLRSDIDATDILTGTLVTADRRATAILVGVPLDATGDGAGPDRTALYRRVRAVAEPLATDVDSILVVGAPVAEALLGTHIIEDLALLIPLSLTVIAAVIWLGCRRLWGVMLALAEVGACLVFTFGLMGWLGVPVYLSTAVLPVILTTIGLADEIHIFWHYQRLLGERAPQAEHRSAVRETMAAMTRPVVLTSLTTSIGFLSFLASSIPPVRTFGLFAAVGILFCMLWSLCVIPAALTLLPAQSLRRPQRSGDPRDGWIVTAAAPLIRRRRVTLTALVLLTLVAAWGALKLHVQDSWIDGFAAGSPFRVATDRVNAALHGTHVLLAHLAFDDPEGAAASADAAPPDLSGLDPASPEAREARRRYFRRLVGLEGPPERALLDPKVLNAIGEFEEFIRARPEVGGVLGTYSHLVTVAYLWLHREDARSIPAEPRQIRRLLERFDMGRGEHRRREVIDDERRRTVVTIFLKNANYRETAELMAALRQYAEVHLAPLGGHLGFAGDVAVSQAMIPAIVRTQVVSLSLAVAGALVCLCLLFRSLRFGLYAVGPTAVAVLWVFGAMGWLGIPLGVATSMFCAITLGIGVDYAIHFLERLRRARASGREQPVLVAVEEAGPAIVADTVAIALGFGLLAVSQVPANARLGVLVAMALGAGCLLTLGGLAALLAGGKLSPKTGDGRRGGVGSLKSRREES